MTVAIDENSTCSAYAKPGLLVFTGRLAHLLGFNKVRSADSSWTEWGNALRVPNEVGAR